MPREHLSILVLVLALAIGVALMSARPYAGGWNDGSRLATVESLVDDGTFAIDGSIFVNPRAVAEGAPAPYRVDDRLLMARGTLDKLWIGGHFYSDKPPFPQIYLAGWYRLAQGVWGLEARRRADLFCYWMTFLSSGLGYIAFAGAGFLLARRVLGAGRAAVALVGSFALGTMALAYTRHVNAHVVFLGVATLLILTLHLWVERLDGGGRPLGLSALLGSLMGMGYATDVGVGLVLVLCLVPLVIYRSGLRRWPLPVALLVAALPWAVLHHAINHSIAGVWQPANALPAHLSWAGSPFGPGNMTGRWNHAGLGRAIVYGAELLVGKKGFLLLNLPMMYAVGGICWFSVGRRHRIAELPEVLFATAWCAGTWLLFAALSNNYGGVCASIRWFLPLLAPGLYIVALVLRQLPFLWPEFTAVSIGGMALGLSAWWFGPWLAHMPPGQWYILGAVLIVWIGFRVRVTRPAMLAERWPATRGRL